MANYFIRVEDAPDFRRRMLESSKGALHVLKGYQNLLVIRGQKLTMMNQLRSELRQLTVLINRAEQMLPVLTERELAELNPSKTQKELPVLDENWMRKENRKVFIAAPKKKITAEVPLPKTSLPPAPREAKPVQKMTELERLEAALSSIEEKLGNI